MLFIFHIYAILIVIFDLNITKFYTLQRMTILYLILNIFAFILIVLFVKRLIQIRKISETEPELKKTLYRSILVLILIIGLPIVFVNYVVSEPVLNTKEQKIAFYKKHKNYNHLSWVYYKNIPYKTKNITLHFKYANTLSKHIDRLKNENDGSFFMYKYSYKTNELKTTYDSYLKDSDSTIQDIGKIILGIFYTDIEDYSRAISLLEKVKVHSKYYNYALGKCLARTEDFANYKSADSLLNLSLSGDFPLVESYNELAILNYHFSKKSKLSKLIHTPKAYKYISDYPKRMVFMRNHNYLNYWNVIFVNEVSHYGILGFVSSALIFIIWFTYLRKIDFFEKEKFINVAIVSIMSMISVFLVYPLGDILRDVFGYFSSKNPTEDFIHIVISIGMIEELVKIIPVLIILRFKKVINEPFDYIFYCSISAISFAFIENLQYIQESSLPNINARGFMACVAHMVFSSTIGYGLMFIKFNEYKKVRDRVLIFIFFFVLASLMHGFYDFWLINKWAQSYRWITVVFFILSIHIWHVYANNSLNITSFYDPKIKIKNDHLKFYLILSLIGLLMFSYVVNGIDRGGVFGSQHILYSVIIYGYLILYLTFSFSRFEIVRGYLSPFSIPFHFMIPRIKRTLDYSGLPINLYNSNKLRFVGKFEELKNQIPLSGVLHSRLIVDNNLHSYIIRLETPLVVENHLSDLILIVPKSKYKTLNDSGNILVHFMLITSIDVLEKPNLKMDDFSFVGWVISKKNEA